MAVEMSTHIPVNIYRAEDRLMVAAVLFTLGLVGVLTRKNVVFMLISVEIVQRINKAINDLPPKCRLIFKLVKEDGLKYREAAEVMNISVLTVRNQLAIAIKKIAGSLPAYMVQSTKPLSRP